MTSTAPAGALASLRTFFSSRICAAASALLKSVRRVIHTSLTQISRLDLPLERIWTRIIILRCCAGRPRAFGTPLARGPCVYECVWVSRRVGEPRSACNAAAEEQDQKFQKTRARSTAIAMVENYFGIYLWDHVSYHQFRHTLLLQIMNCECAAARTHFLSQPGCTRACIFATL